MKIILSQKLGKEFIFEYLPSFIYKKSLYYIYKKKIKLEKLLKENFNYTLEQFIKEYKKSFNIKKFTKYYILTIKEGNINTIIRAIDYGVLGFTPQHIFDKIFEYVNNNLDYLYDLWLHYIPV